MKTFIIDSDNNITAYVSAAAAEACSTGGARTTTSESDLEELASGWPAARLTVLWNTLPGVTPVKRFTDRTTAVRRIWNAIQRLDPAPELTSTARHPASKKAQVLDLLGRPGGATLDEIMAVVPWQAHTVRGFLSGTVRKRMGLSLISSRRAGGQRAYHIEGNASAPALSEPDNPRQA
jgi:hypothetical protein